MKKVILLSIGIFASLSILAQEPRDTAYISGDTFVNVNANGQWQFQGNVPDSAKLTYTKIYNDVKAGISGLASALKVGAEYVYYILVKQQVVRAFIFLSLFVFGLIISIIIYKVYPRAEIGESLNGPGLFILVGVICAFALFTVAIANIDTIITGFVNPEYGAIKDIFEFVK